jgi:hypothetical protein
MTASGLRTVEARLLAVLVPAAALAAGACTEDALTGPGPEGDEGAETVELVVSAGEMDQWRDTTFSGFALPLDAGFLLAADPQDSATDLRARSLLKYRTVPDSVVIDSVNVAIDSFVSAELRLSLDTARSRVPDPGVRLRLFGLARPFTATEVTWEEAAEGEAWSSPGGDLGRELGSLDLEGVPDSVLADTLVVPVQGEGVADSLLSSWQQANGDNGAALLVEGPGARLRFDRADLRLRARPVDRDTTVELTVLAVLGNDRSTFIHDPPQPPVGDGLRLGGLPAHRAYMTFVPPDTVNGLRLLGATINRAELVFRPAAAPDPPFALDQQVSTDAMELISDPFDLGVKTPIGPSLSSQTSAILTPDSLAAGQDFRIAFTGLMRRWAAAPDSFGVFRLGLRLRPDDQTLNFWEFGSVESAPDRRPFLRLVVTPPSDFDLP